MLKHLGYCYTPSVPLNWMRILNICGIVCVFIFYTLHRFKIHLQLDGTERVYNFLVGKYTKSHHSNIYTPSVPKKCTSSLKISFTVSDKGYVSFLYDYINM